MDEAEVQTVFTVADRSTGTLGKIADAGRKAEQALTRAQQSASTLSMTPAARVEGAKEAGGGGRMTAANGWLSKLDEASRERYLEEKQELKLRRARMLGLKLEDQRENAIHRAAMIATMLVGSEENKYAQKLTKIGGMGQAVGTSMAGLGGTMGKLGGVLNKFGGIASMAGLAFEGLAMIDDATGHHLEHAGEAAANWAAHLVGMTRTQYDIEKAEEVASKALGFRSAKDYKAAEATEERWRKEQEMTAFIGRSMRTMPTLPSNPDSVAGQAAQEQMIDLVRDLQNRFKLDDFDATMKMVQEGMSKTAGSVFEHSRREAELSDIERKVTAELSAVPIQPNAEAVARLTGEIGNAVSRLAVVGDLRDQEAESLSKSILSRALEGDSIQSVIFRHQALADEEAKLEQATSVYAKLMPKIPVHATVDQMLKFNEAVANLTKQAAGALNLTPETAKLFQQKLETKAHHFDFRGSHFNIKQAFEGLDPDRVAVAFTRDLPALGERRVQSQFAPIFSI